MFQLHLPRYSSPVVLKKQLLVAIQNAGQRGDGGASQQTYLDLDDVDMTSADAISRPTHLLTLPVDAGGHREELDDLCARARVDPAEMRAGLKVTEMRELLDLEVRVPRDPSYCRASCPTVTCMM